MKFLKAITTEGKIEYFNLSQILTITPERNAVKILMGAGLHYRVKPNTLVLVDLENLAAEMMGGYAE